MTRARDLAAFVSNADGDVKFDTDTLFIDSSANKVGIGRTDPAHPLDVDGEVRFNSNIRLTEASSKSETGSINLADSALMQIQAFGTGGEIAFDVGSSATERFRITNNGVTFNGDTAAANALDDFEQSTWTPALASSIPITVNTGGQPASNSYIKIGKLVYVSFDITVGSSSSSSHVMITSASLPYPSQNYAAGVIGWTDYETKPLAILVSSSGLGVYHEGNDGTTAATLSGKRIIGFAHYITA